MKKAQNPAINAAASLILFTMLGTAFFYRDFAQFKLGPLYLLELVTAVSFLLLGPVLVLLRRPLVKDLKWALMFSAYGLLLVAADVVFRSKQITRPERFLQHAGMIVYPAAWITLGYLLQTLRPRLTRIMVIGASALAIVMFLVIFGFKHGKFFEYEFYSNLAMGPLAAVLLVRAIYRVCDKGRAVFRERRFQAELGIGLLFTLIPFCSMWLYHVKRTSLVGFALILFATPLLLSGFRLRPTLKTSLVGLLLFLGAVAGTLVISTSSGNHGLTLGEATLRPLQHGEDLPQPQFEESSQGSFQGRFRRFLWSQTLTDWRASPLLGVGFIPEVPSWIAPYQKNDGNYDLVKDGNLSLLNGKPVSGPHNSYLNILARTGLVGLALFLLFAGDVFRRIVALTTRGRGKGRPFGLTALLTLMIFLSGAQFALFHTGLESGYNCHLMWLTLGMIYARKDLS